VGYFEPEVQPFARRRRAPAETKTGSMTARLWLARLAVKNLRREVRAAMAQAAEG